MDLVAGPEDAHAGRILLLGSDSREGENEQIGGADSGQRPDDQPATACPS